MKRIGRWILAALAIALLIGAALAENAGEALPGRAGEATAEISTTQAGNDAPSDAPGTPNSATVNAPSAPVPSETRDALNVYPALAEFSAAAPEYWLGRAAEKLAEAETESDALADALGDMLSELGAEVNSAADALGEDLTQTIQAGCELILGKVEWW